MKGPYHIERPAVINFSGGRSSAFMLYKILEAYEFDLPKDIEVIFTNTGLEHHETYEFIHRIEESWCPVTWLQYCLDDRGVASWEKVSYETASRNGEPFTKLIQKKKYLPNPVARICTENMKIITVNKYMKEMHGLKEWNRVLGLRYEEQKRVSRMREKENVSMPIADAFHTISDVIEFWIGEDIDLNLPLRGNIWSNCVGCFLKSYQSLEEIARHDDNHFQWWIDTEEETGNRFRNDRPAYSSIKYNAHRQLAFDFGDTIDCYCTD